MIGSTYIPSKEERDSIIWEIDGDYERQLAEEMAFNPSLKNVFSCSYDLTELILPTLWKKTHGKKPDHFIVIITGIPGITSTGIGKSSTAQIMAEMYSNSFSHEMIGFTNDQILDIMEKFALVTNTGEEVSQVFIRDETPDSLKRRAEVEASIMIESLRDSKISIILIKPENIDLCIAHYVLTPLAFSRDFKYVKVAVMNPNRDFYRGYIVLPIKENNPIWNEYQIRKKEYQKMVTERKVSGFDHRQYADNFIKENRKVILLCIKGTGKVDRKRLLKYVNDMYPNFTGEERSFVMDDVVEDIQTGKISDG
jgi:hypothetical protein